MKSSRFSQEQIIGILKQGEAGVKVTDLCRQHAISDHTLRQAKVGDSFISARIEGREPLRQPYGANPGTLPGPR